jgi:hypothetical protein
MKAITVPVHIVARTKKFRKALLYQGIFSRAARQAGVSRTHAYLVATGARQSERVAGVLLKEITRVERKCAA